ncbi:unnamed protein product [Ranitomeya imitator]|uniref:LisH domain-containing protein n=1 Tax=Ranitomeya imitator TaxID=111125 RepID=A0ABN9KX17_9NEOB|nr:unnamed protein product [Ranitomeya imitator]
MVPGTAEDSSWKNQTSGRSSKYPSSSGLAVRAPQPYVLALCTQKLNGLWDLGLTPHITEQVGMPPNKPNLTSSKSLIHVIVSIWSVHWATSRDEIDSIFSGQMSQGELKSLSQEELRKRLYQTFKKKGVLDSLKTQLRNQLIQDLKLRVGSGQSLQSPLVSGDSLLHRACNSLVADHLSRCGYEFSLSVFYPECGLEKDKDFSIQDLMQLLKINPKSSIYKSLMSTHQNSSRKGFLVQILAELIDNHLNRDGRDANTQTAATSPYRESIVEKLKFYDERFRRNVSKTLKI